MRSGKEVEVMLSFDLDLSLDTEIVGVHFYINLTRYTFFKWTVTVWLYELSHCIYGLGKSCIATMATNREDLV